MKALGLLFPDLILSSIQHRRWTPAPLREHRPRKFTLCLIKPVLFSYWHLFPEQNSLQVGYPSGRGIRQPRWNPTQTRLTGSQLAPRLCARLEARGQSLPSPWQPPQLPGVTIPAPAPQGPAGTEPPAPPRVLHPVPPSPCTSQVLSSPGFCANLTPRDGDSCTSKDISHQASSSHNPFFPE